jgi:4'-phosphopantetheinyl transferase
MLLRPQHTIGPGDVHVWHVLADQLPAAEFETIDGMLSPKERARMNAFAHERDRALFLLSRGVMRSVLASYLCCGCDELQFAVSQFGKPILPANGDEAALRFNLSHSRGAIVLAVSGAREVGVDIEERSRRVDYLGLAERFFAAKEARHLRSVPEGERADTFFAIWTLKEAYVKGIGRGLTFPLDAFCFDLDVSRLVAFRALEDFVAANWQFHQFDVGTCHAGAVAVEGDDARIELRDWAAAFISG